MLSRRGKLNFLLINALIKVNLSLTNYVFLVDSRVIVYCRNDGAIFKPNTKWIRQETSSTGKCFSKYFISLACRGS